HVPGVEQVCAVAVLVGVASAATLSRAAAIDGAGQEIVEAVEDLFSTMAGVDEGVDEGAAILVSSLEAVAAFDEGDIAKELIVGVDAAAGVAGGGADGT